ncbi:MAG: phosphate ABC transporter permease PstA [Desulfobia sp.]
MNKEKQNHIEKRLSQRHRGERRFRRLGLFSVILALSFLAFLLTAICVRGWGGFQLTYIKLPVHFDQEKFAGGDLKWANYNGILNDSLRSLFPEVKDRLDRRQLYSLVSGKAPSLLRGKVTGNPDLVGTRQEIWLPASADVDLYFKGKVDMSVESTRRRIKDKQAYWLDSLKDQGRIDKRINTFFFKHGDSRNPEFAGIKGAVYGSLFTLLVTFCCSFPIGVGAAIYLEEFAPRNKFTDLIEINVNNLAAVPSIVFGLLGLAVFINFFGLPRSIPLVGGLVLTLMTMPTIIISSRSALKSVPPSIREAALGVGASHVQTVFHHVIPLALPGMLTGTIIGMAQALGETAPLLMIGMIAFIVDIPHNLFDPATVLPVQIYLWAGSPEKAFVEKTAAAIMVLLLFLIIMNGIAVWLRKKCEKQW